MEISNSQAPKATIPALGEPNRPGSTPWSYVLMTPLSLQLRGVHAQNSVDGVTPPMFSALRGCWRYAIALAMSACPLFMPGTLRNRPSRWHCPVVHTSPHLQRAMRSCSSPRAAYMGLRLGRSGFPRSARTGSATSTRVDVVIYVLI
jgi:hypothetical protein